jgi:hypothetical protein
MKTCPGSKHVAFGTYSRGHVRVRKRVGRNNEHETIPGHDGKRDIALITKFLEIDETIRKVHRSTPVHGCQRLMTKPRGVSG